MKRHILTLALLAALLFPSVALAQGGATPLVVSTGQRVSGSISTVSQDIQIDGVVVGDVTTWDGDVTISGQVLGDVVSYTGQVTVAATGRVGGHVLALGGGLMRASGALIGGQALEGGVGASALASVVDILSPARGAADGDEAVGRVLFGAALGALLLAFCLLSMAFWPRRTAAASQTLLRLPGRTLAMGLLLTLALLLGMLPLAALLAVTLIGIPLVIALLLLLQVPYVYGLAAVARGVALRRAAGAAQPLAIDWATVASVVALVVLISLVGALAPLAGLLLFYLVASPGLGAVVLSRGGMLVPA